MAVRLAAIGYDYVSKIFTCQSRPSQRSALNVKALVWKWVTVLVLLFAVLQFSLDPRVGN